MRASRPFLEPRPEPIDLPDEPVAEHGSRRQTHGSCRPANLPNPLLVEAHTSRTSCSSTSEPPVESGDKEPGRHRRQRRVAPSEQGELVTSDDVPPRLSSRAVAARRGRTQEFVQIGRTARRRSGEPRHAAEAAPRRRPGADGEPIADRGWTVFQIPSAPWVLPSVGSSVQIMQGLGRGLFFFFSSNIGGDPHLPLKLKCFLQNIIPGISGGSYMRGLGGEVEEIQ